MKFIKKIIKFINRLIKSVDKFFRKGKNREQPNEPKEKKEDISSEALAKEEKKEQERGKPFPY
ncbi:hypothetical protein KKG58_05665 [Patescibacteria group bacterium]|nr:hypothetical protein [Patescibacteria group bacterium]